MITVLHTESSMGWGGQEKRTLRELAGLCRENFRPLLACRPGSRIGEKGRAQGIPVLDVKMRGNWDPMAVARLLFLCRRHAVDIVHTHSAADSWIATTAAKLSGKRPLVIRTRHLSCSFHTRMIYNLADRVITVGESTRQYMIREKNIEAEKVLTIPTGLDLGEFDPEREKEDLREELGISSAAPVLGTVAVLRKLKGHRFLLEAMPEILRFSPEARLLLVGEGPQEGNLRRMIDELGIASAVIMPGFREDVVRVLNTVDVFVFPSLEEALGTAVLEAMAMGKPVVASRVGGIPEIVEEGSTGYLVDPQDSRAMARKVRALLGDKNLAMNMGARGRKFVRANSDCRLMVKRLEELYGALLARRNR